MGRKKAASPPQGTPRTRSKAQAAPDKPEDFQSPASREAEVKFYTTLRSREGRGADVQVISKRKLRDNPENYDKMKAKFDAVVQNARARAQSDSGSEGQGVDLEDSGSHPHATRILWVTHFNVFLYATCFFIQVGTMPVKKDL